MQSGGPVGKREKGRGDASAEKESPPAPYPIGRPRVEKELGPFHPEGAKLLVPRTQRKRVKRVLLLILVEDVEIVAVIIVVVILVFVLVLVFVFFLFFLYLFFEQVYKVS